MPRCDATTEAGTPCRAYAKHGETKCTAHLGLVGREVTLTAEMTDQLVAMLRAGNYINVACKAAGLPRRTYTEWMRRGRSGAPADALYRSFRKEVEQARAMGEVRHVAAIASAARKSWQAAAWLLERQYPDRWGRTPMRIRESLPPELPATVEPEPTAPDPFAEIDELAERRRRGA
ncbi:MAG TPA: hypothetical protein VFQ71_07955 [Gaiellales bacterium]|jgi:hypothetical protein|nr:hypothetical protein [Gaiellales bacterium]